MNSSILENEKDRDYADKNFFLCGATCTSFFQNSEERVSLLSTSSGNTLLFALITLLVHSYFSDKVSYCALASAVILSICKNIRARLHFE